MKCKNCGNELLIPDASFCDVCGAPIVYDNDPAAIAAKNKKKTVTIVIVSILVAIILLSAATTLGIICIKKLRNNRTTTNEVTTTVTTQATIDSDRASNEILTYNVEVEIQGDGSVKGTGEYTEGETATLIASSGSKYTFSGWYVSGSNELVSSDDTIEFVVDSNITLIAIFKPVKTTARETTTSYYDDDYDDYDDYDDDDDYYDDDDDYYDYDDYEDYEDDYDDYEEDDYYDDDWDDEDWDDDWDDDWD